MSGSSARSEGYRRIERFRSRGTSIVFSDWADRSPSKTSWGPRTVYLGMTVVEHPNRLYNPKLGRPKAEFARRVGEYLVRFAIATLALTGLLALIGMPVGWAVATSFLVVDVITLVRLERTQDPKWGIPRFAARMRLSRTSTEREFLN